MTETNRIEFKRELTKELDIEKEVVAFLNYREGGIIYIGIDDNGKPVGVKDIDDVLLRIKDRIRTGISPSPMGLFDVTIEYVEGVPVIKIFVSSGSEKPYCKSKYGLSERGCFIRVGTAAEPMPTAMIDDLYAHRVRNSLRNIRSPRKNLTFRQLRIYYESKGLTLNEHFMENLDLLTDADEPNYVAYLLADENSTSIKVAKYAGTDRDILIANNERGVSSPRNKELMRVFRDVDLVESLGSGMRRIGKVYSLKSIFSFSTNFIRTSIPFHSQKTVNKPDDETIFGNENNNFGSVNGSANQTEPTKRQLNILNLIKDAVNTYGRENGRVKKGLTTKEIISKLNLSERTIYRELAALKQLGLIQRIGSDKTGHWEVVRSSNGSVNLTD